MRGLAVFVLVAGCTPRATPVHGKLGNLDFYWAGGPTTKLAADALVPIAVERSSNGAAAYFTSATASDPDVATTVVDNSLFVNTGAAGTFELSIFAGLTLLDRVDLDVAAVTGIDVQRGWSGEAPTLLIGEPVHLFVAPRSSDGKTPIGWWAVRAQFDAAYELFSDERDILGYQQDIVLVATRPGDATLTLASSDARLEVPVHVVTLDDITSIALTSSKVTVTAIAYAGTTPVYGAHCHWSASVYELTSDDDLGQPPSTRGDVDNRTTAVTCTIGNVSATVAVKP